MIKMNAKFIGRDQSLGLIHGNEYPINIRQEQNAGQRIYVDWDIKGKEGCIYNNITLFLQNWDNLNHTD